MSYTEKQLAEWKRTINAPAVLQSRLKLEQVGNEYVCSCPFHKEKTPSFKIYVNGETKQWEGTCHGGCARSWNLWQIVMKTDNLPFTQAVEKVLTQVGWEEGKEIANQTFTTVLGADVPKITFPLSVMEVPEKALPGSLGETWLANRGITLDTARAFHLGYIQSVAKAKPDHPWVDEGWVVIPTITNGIITCVQYRSMVAKKSEDGSIQGFVRIKHMKTLLYNFDNSPLMDDVFVTEGLPDVWAFHQGGYAAVGYASAGYNPTQDELDRLVKANRIFLAGDSDQSGREAMSKLYDRIRDRVYRIVWPEGCKDANDFLHKVCGDDVQQFQEGIEALKLKALATPIGDYYDLSQTLMVADDTPPMDDPLRLHFRNSDLDNMAVLPPGSVVAVYATYTGSGKTTWCLDQFELLEAMNGRIVLNYSAELTPKEFGILATASLLGKNRLTLTDADYKEAGQMLQDTEAKFYVGYNPSLNRIDLVLDSIDWAIRRFGANIIVLDHLHFLTRGASDEIREQANAMQRIKNMALQHKVIFVVVGQSRKPETGRRGRPSDISDAKGSETFTSDASAVYHIHRGVRKDVDMSRPETLPEDILEVVTDIRLVKCRTRGPGKPFARMVFAGSIGQFHTYSLTTQEPQL